MVRQEVKATWIDKFNGIGFTYYNIEIEGYLYKKKLYVTSPFSKPTHQKKKKKKHGNFFLLYFLCWTYTKIFKISTKILAESPLYREVPSYRQIICTHPVFIVYAHSNHSKSQTVTPRNFKKKKIHIIIKL
jgi:hypothetical protein